MVIMNFSTVVTGPWLAVKQRHMEARSEFQVSLVNYAVGKEKLKNDQTETVLHQFKSSHEWY